MTDQNQIKNLMNEVVKFYNKGSTKENLENISRDNGGFYLMGKNDKYLVIYHPHYMGRFIFEKHDDGKYYGYNAERKK